MSGYHSDSYDLKQIVDFWNKTHNVVGIVGHSKGGATALLYASLYQTSVRFIVNASGRFHFRDVAPSMGTSQNFVAALRKQATDGATEAFLKEFANMDMVKICKRIPNIAILSCSASMDEVVPPTDAQDFGNYLHHHTLFNVKGSNHNYTKPPTAKFEVAKGISDWIVHLFSSMESWAQQFPGRIIESSTIQNLRHIGDYPTIEGNVTVKTLWRSGDLNQVSRKDIQELYNLGIRHVLDLRSVPELERKGFVNLAPIVRHHTPVYAMEDYSPMALASRFSEYASGPDGFGRVYPRMLVKAAPVLHFLCHLILEGEGGVLFHCSAGKDRTGVVAMSILLLLHVDIDIIVRDYAISENLLHVDEAEFAEFLKRMNGALTREGAQRMMQTKRESMSFTVKTVQEEWGQWLETFFIQVVDLTPSQISELRRKLTVPRMPILPAKM
jgi:protein tyrosine/serine phosphatase